MTASAPPKSSPQKPNPAGANRPQFTRGHITAQGVFAELAIVKPVLEAHQQALASKLIPPLAQRAKIIVAEIKPETKKDPQKLEQISTEVAQETLREALENLGKVQDPAQISQVVADSLTSTIITHPDINPNLDQIVSAPKPSPSADEERIQSKAKKAIANIVKDNQSDLEKAAVLKNLEIIADLPSTGQTPVAISEEVENFIHQNSLLDPKDAKETLTAQVGRFTLAYASNFNRTVAPQISQNRIPTLAQLNQVKTQVYEQSVATLRQSPTSKEDLANIETITQNISHLLSFKPISQDHVQKIGLGTAAPRILTFARPATTISNFAIGLALSTSAKAQQEGFNSSLAGPQLDSQVAQKIKKITELKKKRGLTYKERKDYIQAEKERIVYERAQTFAKEQAQKKQTYVSTYLQMPLRSRLNWSQDAQQTVKASFNYYPGIYVSPPPARRLPSLMPTRFFGGQAAKIGSFANTGKSAMQVGKLAGGGALAPTALMAIALKPIRDIGKVAGGTLVGLAMYFLGLGKIAMAGFMIGAGIGGTVGLVGGTIIGLQVAAICGPFAPACALITVPTFALTGGFIGAAIGGTAGALIALGLASGSATMASMGAGAAAGGTIGGVVGFNVGAGLTATAWTVAIGACIGSVVCAPLAPFMVAVGPAVVWTGGFIGAAVGATVGTLVGATVGYLIGNYVLPSITNTVIAVKNFFSSGFSATGAGASGFFSAAGSFFTGLASNIWGGIVSAGGNILGSLGSSFSSLFGLGGAGSSTAAIAAVATPAAVGSVAICSIVVGITASAAFFDPDPTGTQLIGGDNEFYTISKSAEPASIPDNNSLPATITFTITLAAKESRLTGISFNDQINISGRFDNFSQNQNLSSLCDPPIVTVLEPQAVYQCRFEFEANNQDGHDYRDSQVVNTVTVRATPQNASQVQDSATAAVSIGHPPSDCPSGWPLATGFISQGPQGSTSHNNLYPQEQAIDIAGNDIGTPTTATFTGTVSLINLDPNDPYGIYVDVTGTCNNAPFTTRWAHLNSVDNRIGQGRTVNLGDRIGSIDATGHVQPPGPAGTHLHYSFFGLEMRTPYIPNNPASNSCDGQAACNVSW